MRKESLYSYRGPPGRLILIYILFAGNRGVCMCQRRNCGTVISLSALPDSFSSVHLWWGLELIISSSSPRVEEIWEMCACGGIFFPSFSVRRLRKSSLLLLLPRGSEGGRDERSIAGKVYFLISYFLFLLFFVFLRRHLI